MTDHTLQPLRIPSGWEMVFNNFTDLEPDKLSETQEEIWGAEFIEDLLYLRRQLKLRQDGKILEHELGIDLGWYPEGDPRGSYQLLAVRDGDWENPLRQLETREKAEVVAAMESWLEQLPHSDWSSR